VVTSRCSVKCLFMLEHQSNWHDPATRVTRACIRLCGKVNSVNQRQVKASDSGVLESEFRIIGYAKSPIELEMAKDDYTAALPWEWLKDSLAAEKAGFAHEAGTTTT